MKNKFRILLPSLNIGLILKRTFSTVVTTLLLSVGLLGMFLAYLNPISWVSKPVSDCLNYYSFTFCNTHALYDKTNSIILSLNSNSSTALAVSASVFILGILQPEVRSGILSVPSKAVAFYKKCVALRNWVIAKIEYLNAESGKWKTAFNVVKSPYILLNKMGFSPQMAISFLAVGGVATTSVAVNETVFADKSFLRGDAGVYSAPRDVPLPVTAKNVTEEIEKVLKTEQNTLAITLGAVPVREIKIENVSVGAIYKGSAGSDAGNSSVIPSTCDANNPAKTGTALCPAILVSGIPANGDVNPAIVATRLRIAEMTLSRSRCKEIIFEDVDAHTIDVSYNTADGLSIYQQPGTAPRRNAMGGHHQAENMTTSGGTYDRLLIIANSSGVNGEIGKLDLSNIYSKGGICLFKNLDIGQLKITENEAGDDNTLSTKEFQIKNTVLGANWTVIDNVEINMIEPTIEVANP